MNFRLLLPLGLAIVVVGSPHWTRNQQTPALALTEQCALTLAGEAELGAKEEESQVKPVYDIGRAIVLATTNSRDAANRAKIINPSAEKAFREATGLKSSKYLEVTIFHEFMYFYIYMTTREARLQGMSQRQFDD